MGKATASMLIKTAKAEIGYKEKASNSNLNSKTGNAGHANFNKYAAEIDSKYPTFYNGRKNGYDWCDIFNDWCFIHTFGLDKALQLLCQPKKSAGAGCYYSLHYYKSAGRFHKSNPQPGDQIFFGTSTNDVWHTGIVVDVDGSKVYTVEGNSSDGVASRSYSLSYKNIVGYGRPAYDKEETKPAASTGKKTEKTTTKKETTPAAGKTSTASSKKAAPAKSFDKKLAGTYKTTDALNMRVNAGTKNTIILTIPVGKKVQNHGYFTKDSDGVKWLYVKYGETVGFCHSKWLKKQ